MIDQSLAHPTRTAPDAVRARVLRGLKLFEERGDEIEPKPSGGLSVPSASTPGRSYRVNLASEKCGCLDFQKRRRPCLHVYAATIWWAKRQG